MEEKSNFVYWFIGIGVLVLAVIFFVFKRISSKMDEQVNTSLWSALIVLFVIFAIILISLFMQKIRSERSEVKTEGL